MFDLGIKADLRDLEALTKNYPNESRDARVSKITEALALLDREVKKNTPYGGGPIHVRDSIAPGGPHISGNKIWGTIGTPLVHGEPLERGTKPHFPPVGPIQFWVEKKLNITGPEAASVAFLIARAISKRGTKAVKMFERGFDENEARLMRILEEIPDEIVRRLG